MISITISIIWVALVFRIGQQLSAQDYGMPSETQIAAASATILDQVHFPSRPPEELLSRQFFDNYLEALDGSHLLFLQSDIDEFAWFRPTMAREVRSKGYTWPAQLIYRVGMLRLVEKFHFQTNYLQTTQFDFAGPELWQTQRHRTPYPSDLRASRALWQQETRADYLQQKLIGLPPPQIVTLLTARYRYKLEGMRQLGSEELLSLYLDALARAYDPDSSYLTTKKADEFRNTLALTVAGIGGSLVSKGGYWAIGDLQPGGPAACSGLLHPGDRILAVAEGNGEAEDVNEMPSWRLVDLIRGPKGTTVKLTVLPAGQDIRAVSTVSLVRDNLEWSAGQPSAVIAELSRTSRERDTIGIVRLPLFYQQSGPNAVTGTSADVARLIEVLKTENIKGLILDLRGNPGGSVAEAISVIGLFIPSSTVLETCAGTGLVEIQRSPSIRALYDGPLVVLTSRASASSAEIVAGALQDYGKALIVGDSSTYGKGTVQTLVPVSQLLHGPGGGTVKVTIAKLYRPGGAATQLRGVVPDIILPSETDRPDIGEAQSPNALPWDSVSPEISSHVDCLHKILPELRRLSQARVNRNAGFRLVHEIVGAEMAQTNGVSLNESRRRDERAKADHLIEEEKRVWQDCLARSPRTWNVTLTNVVGAAEPPAKEIQMGGNIEDNDFVLLETERILADYLCLLPAASKPATDHAPHQPPLALVPNGRHANLR